MSEKDLASSEPVLEQSVPAKAATKRSSGGSIFRDPLVRTLAWIVGVLVVVYLVAVVSALAMGLLSNPEPRTKVERDIQYYQSKAMQSPGDPGAWQGYALALIQAKQYRKAQGVIDKASGVVNQKSGQELEMAQAQLYFETKRYDECIKQVDKLRKNLKNNYDALKAQKGSEESRGKEISTNYWDALVIKGEALARIGKTAEAISAFGEYIDANPGSSDILVRRGELLAEKGDKAGAEADFREALKFIPGDKAALDGLKKIGAK